MNKIWVLGILLMALCVTDAMLTSMALRLGCIELNPILRLDYPTFMWWKIGISVVGSLVLIKLRSFKVLVVLNIIMGVVCLWNMFQLLIILEAL